MQSILSFIEGKFILNFFIFFSDFFKINFFSIDYIKKIYFFLGMSILNRIDSDNIIYGILYLFKQFNTYNFNHLNIIPRFLGRISCFEYGLLPGIRSNTNKLFDNLNINHYCGVDLDINKNYNLCSSNINIYQGSFYIHNFIKYIWLIIPINIYTEIFSNYINLEGRYRTTIKAVSLISKIYSDCKVFQLLFFIKKLLLKNNFSIINNFYLYTNFLKKIIYYSFIDYTQKKVNTYKIYKNFNINILFLCFNNKLINSLFAKTISNTYLTDPITKNSKIMNICSNKIKYNNFNNLKYCIS